MFAILAVNAPCSAQEAIPEATLKALKDATVYVRVSQGRMSSTGSGFLIGKRNNSAYIITNEHVVRQRVRGVRRVQVDFNSGSKKKRTFDAEVLSEDKSRDLAVLRIKNDDLPDAIPLKSSNKIRETVPVYILGYPFGDALSTSERGPSVTIGKGTISSIRSDDYDELEEVQIDGDINPGNSGGPIVFADGSLMGVSVATVVGTQIGIGIPGESVLGLLQGRVGSLGVSQRVRDAKTVEVSFTADLIDPLGKLKNISILYVKKQNVKTLKIGEDGRWSKLAAKMKDVKMKVQGQKAAGVEKISGDYGSQTTYLHQVKFTNGKGETFYTGPGEFEIRIAEREKKKPKSGKKSEDEGDGWIGDDADDNDASAEGDDDDWIGGGAEAESVKNKPVDANVQLAGVPYDCVDAECRDMKFERSELMPHVVWSHDHNHFYFVSYEGLVRKVSYPDCVVVKTIDLGAECAYIQKSKVGVCVLVKEKQDLVVLDEETLAKKKTIAVGRPIKRFAASPGSTFAYMEVAPYILGAVDLKTGKLVKKFELGNWNEMQVDRSKDGGHRIGDITMLAVTPDAKYLFMVGTGCLHKFRIKGKDLIYEQVGPRIGSNPQDIEISPDSKYVALPSGGGNGKGYTTYIYRVSNILKKVIELKGGAYPTALAMDKKAGLIYGQGGGFELITFTPKGDLRKSYDLLKHGANTQQLLVHPDGFNILLVHDSGIIHVRLPNGE